MRKLVIVLLSCFCCLFSEYDANATCGTDCWQYCGTDGSHGYCTDYVQYRLRTRQSGDARYWTGNVSANDVKPNDVAIFDFGQWGHVAVVDSVSGENITLSEWNYGKITNVECGVTDKYEIVTSRTIPKSSVTRFWRPSTNNKLTAVAYFRAGDVAWYPGNVSCAKAQRWVYYSQGYPDGGMCWGSNYICYSEEASIRLALATSNSDASQIIFGSGDIDQYKRCSQ